MQFRPLLLSLPVLLTAEQGLADDVRPPTVTFDGSVPFQYASNPSLTSGPKQPDYAVSPYLKLAASGRLWQELTYQFYGSVGVDRYLRFLDENGSVAAIGAHIGKRWEHVFLAFTYERGLYYDEYFRGSGSVANDFGTTLRISYTNLKDGFTAKPSFTAAFRTDDWGAVERTVLSAKLGFEQTIADRWTALLTPHLRHYEYQDDRKGRRDTIFSISSGVKYDITNDISWTTSAGYEMRDSNVPRKSYVNYVIGTSVDFSFDLSAVAGSDRVGSRDALGNRSDRR